MINHQSGLSSELVENPSLMVFKTWQGKALSILMQI